ncbi:phage tail protein [Enterobacter kobei]|uniref:phage tail fiber protein n=1 Tax=Enterobacter kobei TaxID=208224 RepID=UPI003F4318F0
MLYNTGTIAINGNTATGTGTNWTAPASQVRAGQTIIVMSNPVQLFQISSVNSATSMTVTPTASPALSGQKYGILISDNISVDGLAQAMSQLIKEYDENIGAWETFATTSANQSISVTINGTAVTIPGIGKLAQKGSNGALAVADGGTGATTVEGSRTNLGLGSGATRDVATSEQMLPSMDGGKLMDAGSLGFASARHLSSFASMTTGVFRYTSGTQYAPDNQGGVGIQAAYDGSPSVTAFVWSRIGSAYIKSGTANNTFSWVKVYTEANTTKASDGTLKAASPVARIVKTKEENQRTDIDEPGFVWCGCGTANAEAEGITISRLDVGVYMLTGSAGLASSGWQLLPPIDPSGMGELGVVEAEQTDSGELTIRLFKRKYILSDEGEVIKTKGEPIDVPANSWIDVRLDMPADSIWNTKVSGSSLELQ